MKIIAVLPSAHECFKKQITNVNVYYKLNMRKYIVWVILGSRKAFGLKKPGEGGFNDKKVSHRPDDNVYWYQEWQHECKNKL